MDNCNIIRDILPLYAEHMVSDDTRAFVEEHLNGCPSCREKLAEMARPVEVAPDTDPAPLAGLKRRLKWKRILTAILAAALVLAAALSVFAALSSPQFIPYEDGLLEVWETSDGGLLILFDDAATGYGVQTVTDAETGRLDYFLEAWATPWDRFGGKRGQQSLVIAPGNAPERVYYTQNNGGEDVLVYGTDDDDGGRISLPRLHLSYYFLLALVLFSILSLAWVLLQLLRQQKTQQKLQQKCEAAARWIGKLAPAPLCYMLAHLCVKGAQFATYSPVRDLLFILLTALCLYCAALAGMELLRANQREKRV